MNRTQVSGLGSCRFYVYRRGPTRIKVKSPFWEEVFFRRGPDDAPTWESDDGKQRPSDALLLELEMAHENLPRKVTRFVKQIRVRGTLLNVVDACDFFSKNKPTPREIESVVSDGAVRPRVELDAMLKLMGHDSTGKSYRETQDMFIAAREAAITTSYQAELPKLRTIFGGLGL